MTQKEFLNKGRQYLGKICTCDKRWKHHWASCRGAILCKFLDYIEKEIKNELGTTKTDLNI